MIFVEWDPTYEVYEVTQSGGMGVLTTRGTRSAAVSAARQYAEPGEPIKVKGPRSSSFKSV